jgi:5-methylcytosine-specific restriction endonuclease McrA
VAFDRKKWILNALRRASYRYPFRYQAKVAARVERGKYLCAACQQVFPNAEVQLDHIVPVDNPEAGFVSWDDTVNRMFPDSRDGWQVLCVECHKVKSAQENVVRRKRNVDKSSD